MFQEGDKFSLMANLPYGPLNIKDDILVETNMQDITENNLKQCSLREIHSFISSGTFLISEIGVLKMK